MLLSMSISIFVTAKLSSGSDSKEHFILEALTGGRRRSDNKEEMTDFHKQGSFLSNNGALRCCCVGLDSW